MIKALLFDLDETIILDEQVSREAFQEVALVASRSYPTLKTDVLARDVGETARRLWGGFSYADYCLRIGHSAWEGLWSRYETGDHPALRALQAWAPSYRTAAWREALQQQGVTDDTLARALAENFMTARRRYPRYADFDQLVAVLGSRYLLGIVTNGEPNLQREKLAGSGVAHLFQASVVSGELNCGKPDPGIFRHICAQLGVEPQACVMVGDNPERDVAGAAAAGMRSVWVRRNQRARDERYPADLECEDLMAMLPWLERVESGGEA